MTPSQEWKILIRDGFNFLINYCHDYDQSCVDFVDRWGEPSLDMLLHIIQHARGDDRIVAMHILKDLNVPQTVPYLLPFLKSPDLNEQAASAVCLGELRVPQAYPTLKRLVSSDFISIKWFRNHELQWVDHSRLEMINILGTINDPTVIPLFEDILSRMAALEEAYFATTEHIYGSMLALWYPLQDGFLYTLGLYNALEKIPTLALTQDRLRYWLVVNTAGFFQKKTSSYLISGLIDDRSLTDAIAHTITNTYHVSLEEALSYIDFYKTWFFERGTREKPSTEKIDSSWFFDYEEEGNWYSGNGSAH